MENSLYFEKNDFDAEILLCHSPKILIDKAFSFEDACPNQYIAAFPFLSFVPLVRIARFL